MDNAREIVPEVVFCDDPYEVSVDCDVLLLATEWPEYSELDWERVRALMRGRVVFDGRHVLDKHQLAGLGFAYESFGRSPSGRGVESLVEAGER